PLPLPPEIRPASCVVWIGGARQLQARGRAEIALAVLAVAHARSHPPVAEDAVHAVARYDLLVDGRHELEVVRAERTRHPQVGGRPVAPFLSVAIHGDPVRM